MALVAPTACNGRDIHWPPARLTRTTKTKGASGTPPTTPGWVAASAQAASPVRRAELPISAFAFTGIDTSQQFLARPRTLQIFGRSASGSRPGALMDWHISLALP